MVLDSGQEVSASDGTWLSCRRGIEMHCTSRLSPQIPLDSLPWNEWWCSPTRRSSLQNVLRKHSKIKNRRVLSFSSTRHYRADSFWVYDPCGPKSFVAFTAPSGSKSPLHPCRRLPPPVGPLRFQTTNGIHRRYTAPLPFQ